MLTIESAEALPRTNNRHDEGDDGGSTAIQKRSPQKQQSRTKAERLDSLSHPTRQPATNLGIQDWQVAANLAARV